MTNYAFFVFGFLIVLAVFRLSVAVHFIKFLQESLKNTEPIADDSELLLPKTKVILALRGADSGLSQCVEKLLQQNYPDYAVEIVIDSQQDSAWEIVAQAVNRYPSAIVQVSCLQVKQLTCSLKISAMLQGVSILDKETDIEVIAFIDADTVPHANWLRDLIKPLLDPSIGVTTGCRWYVPEGCQWGAWVRYLWDSWNTAAMVALPPVAVWGGCFAIRTQVLHQVNLLESWRHALSDDAVADEVFREHGIVVQAVPQLIMTIREDCDLKSFFFWIRRQFSLVRLYSSYWKAMLGEAIINLSLPCIAIGGLIVTGYTQQWQAAFWLGSGLLGYLGVLLLLPIWMEEMVRRVVRQRGESMPTWSVLAIFKRALLILPTQLLVTTALLLTVRVQQIRWRGITYYVKDSHSIDFTYSPYQASTVPTKKYTSVF